jgi:hypothetical protein
VVDSAGTEHTGDEAEPRRTVAQLVVLTVAAGALFWAGRVDFEWFERRWSVDANRPWVAWALRTGVAFAALWLAIVVRPRVGRWVAHGGRREAAACGRIAGAAVLGLVTAELVLRIAGAPRKHDFDGSCDTRLGEPNARTGWTWRARFARSDINEFRPDLVYSFDGDHNRAPSPDAISDTSLPTVLFVGESIIAGHGLDWSESLPALVGAALGVQVVALGADGYGSNQAFVRLADTLPRYQHVLAIVTLFFPKLVDRVGWVDRPRLAFDGDEPIVSPPAPGFWGDMRLVRLARDLLRYRDEAAILLTGAIFRQTDRLARAHGARALFLTPALEGPRRPRGDRYLIDELLVKQGLTVVDPDWRFEPIPGDGHPNAASTRALAQAVIDALATDPPGESHR